MSYSHTRRGALVLLVATVVAPPALADPGSRIAAKRAEADRVWNQIQQSGHDLEKTIEAYNLWRLRLRQTQSRIRYNGARLTIARSNLRLAQGDLRRTLVGTYKSGKPDLLQTVLGSGSLTHAIDQIELLQRVNRYNANVIVRVTSYKREVVVRQQRLAREKRARAEQLQAQALRRTQIRRALAAQQATYSHLKADIRRLIEEKRRAEALAAARRAEAARRELIAQRAAQAAIANGSGNQTVLASGVGGVAAAGTGGAAASAGGSFSPDAAAPAAATPEATSSPSYVAPPASSTGSAAVAVAMRYLGVPYVWGGASPSGFDCSGLTMYAYGAVGISLPHYTGSQWNVGTHVGRDQLAPGDLVFFNGLGHEGMYIGGGNFIHAPHTGDVVKVSNLSDSWYAQTYVGAVRVTG